MSPASSSVSTPSAAPRYTSTVAGHVPSIVGSEKYTGPSAGAVHRNQTDAPPSRCLGSPASFVAPNTVPAACPISPVIGVAPEKASFAGTAGATGESTCQLTVTEPPSHVDACTRYRTPARNTNDAFAARVLMSPLSRSCATPTRLAIDEPRKMRIVESPGEPIVSKTATPDVDGVQLHQTLGPSYIPVGSSGSTVAPRRFADTLPDVPVTAAAFARSSFAGATADHVSFSAPVAPFLPSTAIQYEAFVPPFTSTVSALVVTPAPASSFDARDVSDVSEDPE